MSTAKSTAATSPAGALAVAGNYSLSYGLIPVVTLKSTIKITGGSGTSSDPYTIAEGDILPVEVGDYIDYGYGKEWKVLHKNGSEVQIVPTTSVESITLGNSSNFTASKISWENAVQTLNEASSDYVNSYATSARVLGSTNESAETLPVPDGVSFGTNSTADYTTWYSTYESVVETRPYTDTLYSTDTNALSTAGISNFGLHVWLGSRVVYSSSSGDFGVRVLTTSGSVNRHLLIRWYSSGITTVSSPSYGLIPVVTLKSTIKITGGSGTSSSPYQISN